MANDVNGYWRKLEFELMPEPILEDELVPLSEIPPTKPPERAEPITSYFTDKLLTLRQGISQINDEIVSRKRLLDRSQDDIDYQITKTASSLEQLVFRIGYNRAIDQKRNFLERELANLRRERRATRLRFWEDVVQLRRELRETTAQYRDALRKMTLIEESD
jgi:hypothetical protein